MSMGKHIGRIATAACIAAMTLAGCAGDPDLYNSQSGLYDVTDDLPPLAEVTDDAWMDAPADCHGRLQVVERVVFEVASVQDGLVAAVDPEGNVICVDTLGGVQEELTAEGHEEHAASLGIRFVALTHYLVPEVDFAAADPTPQPSIDEGDPSPQPSSDPDEPGSM
jgi:hypothetical protein